MNAPKILKFNRVDEHLSFGFFVKILPFTKGQIKVSDLPIPIILQDLNSKQQHEAELIELVRFELTIPEVFAQICYSISSDQLLSELKTHFPDKEIEDLAFFLYKFKNRTHE